MGFFKNLFKGKFKKIGQNAIKNISNGQLIKGGGFLGDLVNKGVNKVTGGGLDKIASMNLGGIGGSGSAPNSFLSQPRVDHYAPSPQTKIAQVRQLESTKQISKAEAERLVIQIGNESTDEPKDNKSNTMLYVLGGAVLLYFLSKKK